MAQHVVAIVVPEAVVDHLEMVEVDEDHRNRAHVALRGDRLLEAVVQQVAVRQPRERVVVRLALELLLVALALDRVLHRAQQQLAVDLAFDEVVLRAALHREERERLVVVAREHDDRHLGRMGIDLGEGLEPVAVRKREVEQDELGFLEREQLQPARQPVGAAQPERCRGILAQHLLDEARVSRVVLDQQDRLGGSFLDDHRVGSVAMVSQKRSIDWTTVMNFSRSTGLVT